MADQLRELIAAGQSIWLDNIRRSMFASGELQGLIDRGLRGMTSNPTIFEKAIGSGNDYDEQLRGLIARERDPNRLFEALAIDDIQHACDLFRPLYDGTGGGDGFVSLEVSPLLARDTQGTIEAAQRLWRAVGRPNLMVKIPATPEGIPAIRTAIAAGVNINVTLVFSVETYEAAANAYLEGLEQRLERGEPIDRLRSVNSVFVSRIDTAVDKLLEAKIAKGEPLQGLLGTIGIANTKMIYQRYKAIFESDRFERLKQRGAHVQRPLWGSTGTKNPRYSDLMYVERLVGENTVNTVPPATLDALLDHGVVRRDTILEDLDGARAQLAALASAQLSLYDITQQLQVDGVKAFADSYEAMLQAIRYKQEQLAGGAAPRVAIAATADQSKIDEALTKLANESFLQKLWAKDPSPWSTAPEHVAIIRNALGWLDFPERVHEAASALTSFADEVRAEFDHVVVLGMGGSSLAPDILRATFGRTPGYPELHILDSSDPLQVKALDDALDIARSLFIVASKSGTTTEPEAFFRYFFERVQKTVGAAAAAAHFIAITDPDTKLDREATAAGFRRVFRNDPTIGGRYSALSYFGMVPAALAGYDVALLLDRGLGALHASARSVSVPDAPGVRFGAAIGALAKANRDKLTIVAHPRVAAFGAWAEQLIAESTGKSGVGIVPIEGEPLGPVNVYGEDRVFVYVGEGLGEDGTVLEQLAALQNAGHPVIRLTMTDAYDVGEQFALWEIATAAAGAVLGIDAFDQPNVQESKDNTKRLLDEFNRAAQGHFREPEPVLRVGGVAVIPLAGSAGAGLGSAHGGDLGKAIERIFRQVKPGDYVAFTTYLPMTAANEHLLRELRVKVRDALHVATTVGFGPRFLHSTGQLHKGGPNSGVFLQLTYDAESELPIPGMTGFRTLERAQALGDFESLDKRNRRGARFNFESLESGLRSFANAIDEAVSVPTG